MDLLKNFKKQLVQSKKLGASTISKLNAQQLSWQANSNSNSITMLVQHMHGNMRSRFLDFLTSDGEKPDRNRDQEFINQELSKEAVLALWEEGWQYIFDAIDPLEDSQLSKTVYIRTEQHSVHEALIRQTAHYAYHTGQIIALGKILLDEKWVSLSIPLGKSEEFNQAFLDKQEALKRKK